MRQLFAALLVGSLCLGGLSLTGCEDAGVYDDEPVEGEGGVDEAEEAPAAGAEEAAVEE